MKSQTCVSASLAGNHQIFSRILVSENSQVLVFLAMGNEVCFLGEEKERKLKLGVSLAIALAEPCKIHRQLEHNLTTKRHRLVSTSSESAPVISLPIRQKS